MLPKQQLLYCWHVWFTVTSQPTERSQLVQWSVFFSSPAVTSPRAALWKRFVWTGTSLCHQLHERWRWDGTQCLVLDSLQAARNQWWSAQSHQVRCMLSVGLGWFSANTNKPKEGKRRKMCSGYNSSLAKTVFNYCIFVHWQEVHQRAS